MNHWSSICDLDTIMEGDIVKATCYTPSSLVMCEVRNRYNDDTFYAEDLNTNTIVMINNDILCKVLKDDDYFSRRKNVIGNGIKGNCHFRR